MERFPKCPCTFSYNYLWLFGHKLLSRAKICFTMLYFFVLIQDLTMYSCLAWNSYIVQAILEFREIPASSFRVGLNICTIKPS